MKLYDLPTIGTPLEGGFYGGALNVNGKPCALIVAPKDRGESKARWSTSTDMVTGARSYCDGHANTTAMAEAGSDTAKWAQSLAIGGFTDWHIPARDQLELLYRHFKPTAEENYEFRSGDNPSSLPAGYPYEAQTPAQTAIAGFSEAATEAFEATWYWTSTQVSDAGYAWYQHFDSGFQFYNDKSYEGRVRAVRLIHLDL